MLSGLDGVNASHQFLPALGLLSWWFLSRQGQSPLLGEHIAAIYQRGIAADETSDGRPRVEEFVVPDPRPRFVHLDDVVLNWPDSTAVRPGRPTTLAR